MLDVKSFMLMFKVHGLRLCCSFSCFKSVVSKLIFPQPSCSLLLSNPVIRSDTRSALMHAMVLVPQTHTGIQYTSTGALIA